ncbi:uncharacterized protein LOC111406640 [Olea europaea var. sylvestris]|uniref:uncharacterized protein LOC111406640 n=1 Tax=Olea europaea var. sylvestris TaxID=158386 RepID=UPI000C1D71F1|nr:uncharacterized protein LOC111406640 [Olea europaea var. sylvestris]
MWKDIRLVLWLKALPKARLVAKGFTQKEDIDFKETFSPVSRKDSFRIIMALVVHFDLELHQMDVKMAFLNDDIDEMIYMVQPENFVSGDPKNMFSGRIQIHRDRSRGIFGLSQKSYIDKILKRFGMQDCKLGDTLSLRETNLISNNARKMTLKLRKCRRFPMHQLLGV